MPGAEEPSRSRKAIHQGRLGAPQRRHYRGPARHVLTQPLWVTDVCEIHI
jgi:hypothetical protein